MAKHDLTTLQSNSIIASVTNPLSQACSSLFPLQGSTSSKQASLPTLPHAPLVFDSLVSPLQKTQGPPMGLKNILKSSCYLNSVLQCLTFTPPFAEYCQLRLHSMDCTRRKVRDCTFCILEQQIHQSLIAKGCIDAPKMLYNHVVTSSNLFTKGRHEDAHELLGFLINDCGKTTKLENNQATSQKTMLDRLFGGVLQSCIQCQQCNARSTKLEDMLDLSLDICQLSSLNQRLASFFCSEVLNRDNKYHCQRCNDLSVAWKRMTIYEAPKVLTIQLKRFDFVNGRKLNHHVQFEERLSIAKYMSKKFTNGPVQDYILYAVIVHQGKFRMRGHYIAIVKETNGKWYVCNDEVVKEVNEEQVLKANAYILFYIQSDLTLSECI